jgi:hypothetical protein
VKFGFRLIGGFFAMYYAIKDLSHDPKLAEALGNMVVTWAHGENIMFCTLSRVADIGLNMSVAGYFRIPTFESRVKFILALIPEWKTDKYDKAAITEAIEKLANLASARNHWIHGDWCANKEKTETVIFNHRVHPESDARRKPVKASAVNNHCDAVRKRANILSQLIDYDSLDA